MRTYSIVAILFACSKALLPAHVSQDDNRKVAELFVSPYFAPKQGAKWEYDSKLDGISAGKVEVKLIKIDRLHDSSRYHLIETGVPSLPGTRTYAVDAKGLYELEYYGKIKLLMHPVKTHTSHSQEVKSPTTGKTMISVSTWLKNRVDIEVPAGTYTCLEVEQMTTERDAVTCTTMWFAPTIGLVKQRTLSLRPSDLSVLMDRSLSLRMFTDR